MALDSLNTEKKAIVEKKAIEVLEKFNKYLKKNDLNTIQMTGISFDLVQNIRCCDDGEIPQLIESSNGMTYSCRKCQK